VYEFFRTSTNEWLKESLKQCDFELPRLETKDPIVLLPNIEVLFLFSQTSKHVPCIQNIPIAMKNPFNTLRSLFFPLTNAFVIQHL
jgi:hypothetical protein